MQQKIPSVLPRVWFLATLCQPLSRSSQEDLLSLLHKVASHQIEAFLLQLQFTGTLSL